MTKLAFTAALAASLATLAVAPASANTFQVRVPYGDLNLSTAHGARTLAHRVFDAACPRPDTRDLRSFAEWKACKENARNDAMEQLNSDNVPFNSQAFIAA